jgi:O-antigen ligase
VAWTLFAFAGAYAWTLVPPAAAIAVAVFYTRPRVAGFHRRSLDLALLACLAVALLQLVPLTAPWRATISPHAAEIDAALRFGGAGVPHTSPISIAPSATLKAAGVALLTMLTFWCARDTLSRGVLRQVIRPIAWSGLAVSLLAMAFRAQSSNLIYGMYSGGPTASPYGPFVNPNHMGTWLVLAIPLTAGYAVARAERHGSARAIAATLDATMIWLLGAVGMMIMAAVVSLSRSTAVGLIASAAVGGILAMRKTPGAGIWLSLAMVAVLAIVLWMPQTARLAARFEKPEFAETWSRPEIWRETLPIIRDFAVTGTGLGGYRTAMLVYQTSDRQIFFNQAHDQYLQLAAEGGVLLLLPLAWAALAFAFTVARRLRGDVSAMFWIRAGAIAGIAGVLVQSVWDTGLRMPANALLLAVVCAIAVADQRH